MSDDDNNIVEFASKKKEETEEKQEVSSDETHKSIEKRVIKCATTDGCKCMYCTYKSGAAEMVMEFLAMDIMNFEKNSGATFCSYDLKDILFETILKVKELEKEQPSES